MPEMALTQAQAEKLDALRIAFRRNMFSVAEGMRVLASSHRASITGSLNNLAGKGALKKIRIGFYRVADMSHLLPVQGADVEQESAPESEKASCATPYEFLRAIGVDVKPSGQIFMMNGRPPLTEEVLVKVANRHRQRYGLPPFSMEQAA